MKDCKNCKYCYNDYWCVRGDLVLPAEDERSFGWFFTRLYGACGKEGRHFERFGEYYE